MIEGRESRFPLLLAGGTLILAAGMASAQGWPTTEWEVYCYRPTCEQWYGDSQACGGDNPTYQWDAYDIEIQDTRDFWDGSKECPSGGPLGTEAAKLLQQASVWLESMGFKAPLLPKDPSGTKYIAFVAPRYSAVSVYGQQPTDSEGETIPRPFYVPPIPGLEDLSFRTLILLEPDPKHIAHELFHAIQYNSSAWGGGWGSIAGWIEEGTAEAVGLTFAQRNDKGNRPYDQELNWNAAAEQAYDDQYFWRRVGDQIGSPNGVAYLQKVLAENLTANRGLNGVDKVLKEPGKGLFDELPRFFSNLNAQADFGSVDQIQIIMPTGQREYEKDFGSSVQKVAGTAHRLRVRANPTNPDKPLEVEIRFKEDHPDLHLIVDGNRFDQTGFGPRNLFRGLLVQGSQQYFDIVVANVAEEAASTEERNYKLLVKLREVDWCTMTARVTGDIGGSYFGDVAHFSTKGGATIYGAFSNPEMIEGVAGWLGSMAEMAGGEGAEEQIESMKEEWKAGAGEIPRETFGLSLSNQKLDAEGDEALAFIAGGFTLEASVIGPEVGKGVTGSIPLKMLRVVPGPRAESTLDKVPFVWVEGAPGSAQLFITKNTGNLVAGRISGTLYAEGYYKPGGAAPVIVVQASFVALEGPTGCLGIDSLF